MNNFCLGNSFCGKRQEQAGAARIRHGKREKGFFCLRLGLFQAKIGKQAERRKGNVKRK